MEVVALLFLCAVLALCVVFGVSTVYALLIGLFIFCVYGKLKGYSWARLAGMILSGIKTSKNILIVFLMIGMLTALWRASGTIPVIIYYTVRLIHPRTLVVITFLLNCGVSMLTGSAFGAAATIGMICMTLGVSLQINPVIVGGAILSGIFFGDRASPVSGSALLVSELTKTSVFHNIKKNLLSALPSFLLSSAVYAVMGLFFTGRGESIDLRRLLAAEFNLHWCLLLPAAAILVLSAFKVNIKITVSVSIAVAALLCFFVQRAGIPDILRLMITGYTAKNQDVAVILNGGGIVSMTTVMAVIFISSAYTGFFQETKLLDPIKKIIARLDGKVTPYAGFLFTASVSSVISCNQTLAIIMTHQLCEGGESDAGNLASNLKDTAVIVAPLVPWSAACLNPLDAAGAPVQSVAAACFLYLYPVCRLLGTALSKKTERTAVVK